MLLYAEALGTSSRDSVPRSWDSQQTQISLDWWGGMGHDMRFGQDLINKLQFLVMSKYALPKGGGGVPALAVRTAARRIAENWGKL